jgi:Zn-dependent peptidase ImmA (M78 family)
MSNEVNINVNMISFAIKRAGYQIQEFTNSFPNVNEWLNNTKKPTLKQLEAFANKVHVPFGYLFLNTPPQEDLPIPFFRSISNSSTGVTLNTYDTILLTQKRQEWLREYLIDNGHEELSFVGKFHNDTDYKKIAAEIRLTLDLTDEWTSKLPTIEKAIDSITEKIEDIGIIVNFNGVVENNTHRPIDVEDCRGFVLVDPIAPFMFVNAADGKAAQLFTIAHELSHIWIGRSAGFDFEKLLPADDPLEILCNKVAAEILVPEESFNRKWNETDDIKRIARFYKVSYIVIARRAFDLGKISKNMFFKLYNDYIQSLKEKKERQSGGGDFYATQKRRLSITFAAFIDQAVRSNKLLYRDAYKITGLKGDTYQKFINKQLNQTE